MASDRKQKEQSGRQVDWASRIAAIAAEQDRAAFAELFAFFAPRIKSFMLRSGVAESSADELAQETMLMVWRKAGLFNPASTGAGAWIFTIARNLRIDAHRRERRGATGEVSDVAIEFEVDDAPLPDARLESVQWEKQVRAALSQLPEDQVKVLELSFFEEKAHAEIAHTLRIPLGTVKSRMRLAINRLRILLSEKSGE